MGNIATNLSLKKKKKKGKHILAISRGANWPINAPPTNASCYCNQIRSVTKHKSGMAPLNIMGNAAQRCHNCLQDDTVNEVV